MTENINYKRNKLSNKNDKLEYLLSAIYKIKKSLEDIVNVVNNLTEDDYTSRLEYIKENFDKSLQYGSNLFERADNEIKKLL